MIEFEVKAIVRVSEDMVNNWCAQVGERTSEGLRHERVARVALVFEK